MENCLVIGASGAIGSAVASALSARGAQVTTLSRSSDGIDFGVPENVNSVLDTITGPLDLIFVATGALDGPLGGPEKSLRSLTADHLMDQFKVNSVGPAMVLSHTQRLLPKDKPAIFAALSARVGSIGDNRLGGWYSYRASKAALNQLIHTAAIELARTHPKAVAVSLHPGTVQSDLTKKYLGRHSAVTPQEAARNLVAVMDMLEPHHSGGFFDWAGTPVPW